MTPALIHELKRKAFHGLSLLYILLYGVAGRDISLRALGSAFAVVALVEIVRLRWPAFNRRLIAGFGGIHRAAEERRPSGILWTLLGCFLTIWLVPDRDVVLASLWYLALGDTAAAMVGRHWGRLRIGDKSLEGSLACFLACWWAGILVLTPDFGVNEVLLGALVATVVEAVPLPLNDNLWLPLLPGLALTWLRAAS
jgi:diacylglycerol kinase (CTP)